MVEERNSSGTLIATTYDDTPATVESAINLLNATARVNIYVEYASPSDTAVPVGFIDFNTSGSPQSQINFVVGEGGFAADDTEMSLGSAMRCSTWRGFTAPVGVDTRLYGRLNGDLIGSGGTFTNETFLNVDKLSFLVIDGQLNARINFQAPASTFFAAHAGSMGQHGRIELQSGDIDRVRVVGDISKPSASNVASIAAHAGNIDLIQVTAGSLHGDVIARGYSSDSAGGRIGLINVASHIGRVYTSTEYGDPDSAAAFPTLMGDELNQNVLCIEASNGIDRIEADTITAVIQADRAWTSGNSAGTLEQLVTREGSFKGVIRADGLQGNDTATDPAALDIAEDFRGNVLLIDGDFYGLFKVRGSLLPLSRTISGSPVVQKAFECGEDALKRQIIVNGNDTSETWSADVQIGSTTLSHTNGVYSNTSVDLGGGAVGLAPFKFYPTDCVPEHDDVANGPLYSDFLDEEAVPVILRWFGPVKLPEGYGLSTLLKVECRNPHEGGECEWIDQTVVFSLVLHPFGDSRAIGLAGPGVPKDGIYRVRYAEPSEAKLLCDQVEGNPVAGNFPSDECSTSGGAYYFRIDADCNNNGIPDSVDIANNGSLDVDPQNGVIDSCQVDTCPCDWDGSRYVAVPDIFAFLADWFAEDPDARCFGATGDPPAPCGVSAIFAFLSCWFAANPMDPC